MDNYGMNMDGPVYVERLNSKPEWTSTDVGRIIFDNSTSRFWLGTLETIDTDGWVSIGLTGSVIRWSMIDWDLEMLNNDSNKVSAINIPCTYDKYPTYIQTAIDYIESKIDLICSGACINPGIIRSYHLDITGPYQINADRIPVLNLNHDFPTNIKTVEDALLALLSNHSSDILLSPTSTFGEFLGFDCINITDALFKLEQYLFNLNASQVKAIEPTTKEITTVQFILDNYLNIFDSLNFIELVGVPDNYGQCNQFLTSSGMNFVKWDDLNADKVNCKHHPTATVVNLQELLDDLSKKFDKIESTVDLLVYDASDIKYSGDKFKTINDVLTHLLSVVPNHTHDDHYTYSEGASVFALKAHNHACDYSNMTHSHSSDCPVPEHSHDPITGEMI